MKPAFLAFLIAATVILFFSACKDENKSEENKSKASTATRSIESNEPVKTVNTSNAAIKEIVQHYLHVKNALAEDNGTEAANGAKSMIASIDKTDQASFTEEQKKVYEDIKDDLKEQADHTANNADKIDHQREHFIAMSQDVHDLVKSFGTTQTLYVDHCPMANDHKGANWISETEEIRNPYMGKKMPKCGKVEQVIKN